MQRKFLEDLGLEKEVIDKVMAENGNDIEKTKSKLESERDDYKARLETAQKSLKEFEGIDVNELKNKIEQLNTDLENKDTEYKAKLSDMEFTAILDSAISGSKARNIKAVKSLLDLDTLKSSKNQSEDIKTALEKIKSENDYLFESNEPHKNPIAPTNNPKVAGITKEAFEKMGYNERLKLKQTDPEKYNEMRGN